MKNFTNNFKQFTSRLSARWLIIALMMLVGTSSVWGAQNNLHWKGKVYFLVPEKWDLSTYSTVQVDITRTTSATTSNHQEYIGKMTRIGTSRLFYIQIDANHSNWNQNEYIAFTANSSTYNSGSFNLNGNKLYTTPLDYGCNNSNNYYLFKPSTESQFTTTTNGNTLTASYNSARDNVLKANQTVYIYTNGSSSTSGGSVSLTGYYLSSDDEMTQSTVNSSSTSAEYKAAPGSEMNLTAVAKSGYEFEGWYTDASGGTLLSSNASYTYNVYQAKKIYARFKQSCVTVEDPDITSDSPICLGSELTLTLNKRQDGVTYKIDGQKIFTENNTTYSFVPQASGTGSLTVVASHETACNGSVTKTITFLVTPIPETPTISSEQASICSGSQATINIQGDAETYLLYVHDNGYTLQGNIKPEGKTFKITPQRTTKYVVKALNGESCYSTEFSNDVTINVTTTPTITGLSATQPNKEITLSSAAGANTWWETSGGTLTTAKGTETVFTATENGNYTITAKNTDNNITCSATHPIVVNDKFYIYICRPKSGTTTYDQWYEKTNDADKGAHPWMKNGSEYKTGDDYTNNNYDGNGPESTFTDCNGYVWDAFIAPGTSFFIHAPNTFQEGGQEDYATFTQVTNITSTATDLYYRINEWASDKPKGTTLSPASEPNRIPEVAVPVLSIDPVSGIICQGAEATITVTNPENGVSYKLNYEGKDQTNSIAYTGTGKVEFAVTEAGTYLVKAETTSGTCKGNAVSIAREIQVITTSISFEGAPYVTTPWEPITIIVNVPKGYNYTFDDTKLTQIASPDTPIKKVSGSEYTYSFPRPQEWGTGNSQTGDSWGEKTYTISATLNGVTETCGTTTATVKLQDEGNDNCRTTNN